MNWIPLLIALPVWLVICILAGVGAHALMERRRTQRRAIATETVTGKAPAGVPRGGPMMLITGPADPADPNLPNLVALLERQRMEIWSGQTINAALLAVEGFSSDPLVQEQRFKRVQQTCRQILDRCRGNRPIQRWLTEPAERVQCCTAVMEWCAQTIHAARKETQR